MDLQENGSYGKVACVRFDDALHSWIKMPEDGRSSESMLQFFEGLFALDRPFEFLPCFLSGICQRLAYPSIAFDKPAIEVGKS